MKLDITTYILKKKKEIYQNKREKERQRGREELKNINFYLFIYLLKALTIKKDC